MPTLNPRLRDYAIAVGLVLGALVLTVLLNPWTQLDRYTPFMLFFGALTLSAWQGGRGPGLVATLLSAVLVHYLFLEPRFSLSLSVDRTARMALFVAQGGLISLLVGSLRRTQLRLKRALRERDQAEADLRQSEERLSLAIEGADMVTWDADLRTGTTIWSPNHFSLLGYEATATGEATIEMWQSRVHPEDLPSVMQAWEVARQQHSLYQPEYRILRADTGEVVWLAASGRFLYDAAGQAVRFVGVLFDVTERKQAEIALRQSQALAEQQFLEISAIYQTAPVGLAILDTELRFQRINESLAKINGVSIEAHVGQTVRDIVPALADQVEPLFRQIIATGQPLLDLEISGETKAQPGVQRTWIESWYPLKNAEGQVVGINAVVQEITERKRAEAALCQSEARLHAVAANLPYAAVFIVDHELRYRLAEGQALQNTGIATADLVGKTLWDALDAALANHYEPYYRQALAGQPFSFEHHSHHRDFISHGTPLYNERGEVDAVLAVSYDITDRKRAEEALAQSRRQFEKIANTTPDLVYVYDLLEDRNIYVNSGVNRVLGYSPQQIADLGPALIGSLIHPDDIPDVIEGNRRFSDLREDDVYDHELRMQHANGDYRWLRCRETVFERAADGSATKIIGTAQDITERKQTEMALRQSEEKLRLATEGAKLGMWYWDVSSDQLVWTDRAKSMFGLPADTEMAMSVFLNAVHPDDRALVQTVVRELQAGQGHTEIEYRTLWPDGTIRWILARGDSDYDAEGNLRATRGVLMDITDRKQIEADLRQSEARYRYLAEAIPQLVWTTDATGSCDYVNQQLCHYSGLTFEQALGDGWLALVHPDEHLATLAIWSKAVQQASEYRHEYRLRRADGQYRWHLALGLPLKNAQGQAVKWFGTCTDIHDQKELEAERERLLIQEQAAREEAEHANRIKDQFLAVLSHELRSPLNPILGWTKLLRTRSFDPQTTAKALETIERNAKLQTQLIEDLLDISRIMRGKLTLTTAPVNLAVVIPAAVETVRLAAEAKNIQITLDLARGVSCVMGDAARLQQVVWNLLTNAVKFTPEGGRVEVRLEEVGGEPSPSSLSRHAYAQLTVTDTGKGIAPDFLPYVFDYFRQEDGSTTRQFGGLGLGLAIVRQIVEVHGGTVAVDSRGEGQGSTFIVCLPLPSREDPEPGRQADYAFAADGLGDASRSLAQPLSGLQILLVDDDLDARQFQTVALEQSGAQVIAVASGADALQVFEQCTPDRLPDLLISDIGMPEMDGYMLIRQLRARSPEQGGQIPAIALTAYAGELDQQQALAAGFQRHLPKPVEPDLLMAAILSLLRPSRPAANDGAPHSPRLSR